MQSLVPSLPSGNKTFSITDIKVFLSFPFLLDFFTLPPIFFHVFAFAQYITLFYVTKYSQTCSKNHLFKIKTRLRRPMLRQPKQISIQSLVYKTSICLTPPSTTFVSQMKKNLSKTTTLQNFTQRKNGKQT